MFLTESDCCCICPFFFTRRVYVLISCWVWLVASLFFLFLAGLVCSGLLAAGNRVQGLCGVRNLLALHKHLRA